MAQPLFAHLAGLPETDCFVVLDALCHVPPEAVGAELFRTAEASLTKMLQSGTARWQIVALRCIDHLRSCASAEFLRQSAQPLPNEEAAVAYLRQKLLLGQTADELPEASYLYLSNLKNAVHWTVKLVQIDILCDDAIRCPENAFHTAMHLSNLLSVSEHLPVREHAGEAMVALAPYLTVDQRNEIAVDLLRELENGQEQTIEGVLKTASYDLELSAVDALGSVRAVEYAIPTAAVAVHLAQGGTAVGVGKYAEHDKAVDIAPDWDVWFRGKRLLDAVWPVGSIYLSASEISPETLFGGTWEQVKDRFLLAAGDTYSLGSTGGQAEHTLTVQELPSHGHGYTYTGQSSTTGTGAVRLVNPGGTVNAYTGEKDGRTGGGQPHSNMPPYLAVNIWRRTA